MDIFWHSNAWEDYLHWQERDLKILKRINVLLKEISRTPFKGIGKPEPLLGNYTGCWSRRIDNEHRLVYKIELKKIIILQCRYHYK